MLGTKANSIEVTNEFQEKVKKFINENNMNNSIEYRILDFVNEIGEVVKEICESVFREQF